MHITHFPHFGSDSPAARATDLEKQLETAELNLQNATNEIQHHKEISIVKSTEVSDCQTQLRRLQYEKEKNEARLAKELREREDSLAQMQQTIRQLHEEISEKERREECIKRKDKLLENELETMKEVLNQTQEETVTLKQERELTIVSYQNTFEQLQEALRQKMQSEDGWKAKLEAELENERHKYLLRLEERENKLKEETNIELDIERQKHEELIRKFQKQQVELDEKIPMLIAKAREELQTEIRILEKKLLETQARLTDKDLAKESEIRNLKKIISDLESRLKKEQCKNNSVLEETRKDAFAKSEERKELTQQIAGLRHQLDQANQENELLKETVRMECEERYELTEALTQAKEQLLEQKRLSGNFPSPQRSFISDRSMSSQAVTNAGQKSIMSLSSSKESKITGVPGNSGSVFTSQCRKSSSTSLPALLSQQPSNLRNRTSSVSDAKKKITAVLRSHLTQP
ncbi:cingulin [Bombina bombina]|uniref:cingulin n=1 Tax=Bombina bombina TaxID=8345 RepID=UPI00235B2B86|nr:cingulin [Bombina bombina]